MQVSQLSVLLLLLNHHHDVFRQIEQAFDQILQAFGELVQGNAVFEDGFLPLVHVGVQEVIELLHAFLVLDLVVVRR